MSNFKRVLDILSESVKPKKYDYGNNENFDNQQWFDLNGTKRTFFKYKENIYFVALVKLDSENTSISFAPFSTFKNGSKNELDYEKLEDIKYIISNFKFTALNTKNFNTPVFSYFFYIALEGCNKFNKNSFTIIPVDDNPKLDNFYTNLVKTEIFKKSLETDYQFKQTSPKPLRFER